MEFIPWSASRLDAFSRCKRHGYLSYKHQIDRTSSPPAVVGSILHQLAEKLKEALKIDRNVDLQSEIDKHKMLLKENNAESMIGRYNKCADNLVKWLRENEWVLDAVTEIPIGIDANGALVEYEETKYLRGIIDVMYDAGDDKAIVCDYKSGGRVGDTSQKYVYPYMALCMGYKEVEMRFIYLGEEEPDLPQYRKIYGRYDMEILKAKIDSDMKKISDLPDDITAFLPTPNEWCRYFSCRFICPFHNEIVGLDKTPQELVELYHFHKTKYESVHAIIKAIIATEGNIDTIRGEFGKIYSEQKQYVLSEVISAILDKIELLDLEAILRGTKMSSTDFKKVAKKFKEELAVEPKIKKISKYGYIKE